MTEETTYKNEIATKLGEIIGVDRNFLISNSNVSKKTVEISFVVNEEISDVIMHRANDAAFKDFTWTKQEKHGEKGTFYNFTFDDKFETVNKLTDKALTGIATRLSNAVKKTYHEIDKLSTPATKDANTQRVLLKISKQGVDLKELASKENQTMRQ